MTSLNTKAFGYAKSRRLLVAADYSAVFSNAEVKAACPELLLLARYNQFDHPRLGLVIAKKHVKLATDRNRLKRLIRESFRQRQNQLPNLDIIVLGRPGVGELDNNALERLLAKQWQKISKRTQR